MSHDPSDTEITATTPLPPAVELGESVPLELGHTFTVDNFSGPLDLLLYLVRRTELDILEVPLALIIDQFVETVSGWQDADLDVAGDFILMAATLLEMKARTIVPPITEDEKIDPDEPVFDPRDGLLRSLLAYRKFKEAVQVIELLEIKRRPLIERQFREGIPDAPVDIEDFELGDIDLNTLMTACEYTLSRINGLGPRTVIADEMPLSLRLNTLIDELRAVEKNTIHNLLSGRYSRIAHITTVMASLELARQRLLEIAQFEQFGDVILRLRSNEERDIVPELPPEEESPKRRKRIPLVTFTAPAVTDVEDSATNDDAEEEIIESDEHRFLRELEESTSVTSVLAVTADIETSFTKHWYTLHPELAPAPIELPPAPPAPVARVPQPKKVKAPPTELAPVAVTESVSVIEIPVTTEPTTTSETPVAETSTTEISAATLATVEPPPIVSNIAESTATPETSDIATPAVAEAAEAAEVAEAVATAVTPPVVEITDSAEIASVIEAKIESVLASEVLSVPTVSVSESAPATAAQDEIVPERILPVEEWAVARAMPVEDDPLDSITSDDPAEVNARLNKIIEDDQDDRTASNARDNDLMTDDLAMVNAALQANDAREEEEKDHRDKAPSLVAAEEVPVAAEPTVIDLIAVKSPVTIESVADSSVEQIIAKNHSLPDAEFSPPPSAADAATQFDDEDNATFNDDVLEQPIAAEAATQWCEDDSLSDEQIESDVSTPPAAEAATIWCEDADQFASTMTPPPMVPVAPPSAVEEDDSDTHVPEAAEASTIICDDPRAHDLDEELETPITGEAATDVDNEVDDNAITDEDLALPFAAEASRHWSSDDDSGTQRFAITATTPEPVADVISEPVISEPVIAPEPIAEIARLIESTDEPINATEPETELVATEIKSTFEPVVEIPPVAEATAAEAPIAQATVAEATSEKVSVAVNEEPTVPPPANEPLTAIAHAAAAPTEQREIELVQVAPEVEPKVASADPESINKDSHIISEVEATSTTVVEPVMVATNVATEVAISEPPPDPPPDPPPREPPPVPLADHRHDSPNTTQKTTYKKTAPMSPPPRTKIWPMIAILIAINAAWAGWSWLTYVPKNVVEIAVAPVAHDLTILVGQPTLTWRFNLDVVDDFGLTKPPMIFPQISPAIAGQWSWQDRRTLAFIPSSDLPMATTFTATLSEKNWQTASGFHMAQAHACSWSTPALSVANAAVETFSRDGTMVTLTFNQEVDPLIIAKALNVTLASPITTQEEQATDSNPIITTPKESIPDQATELGKTAISTPITIAADNSVTPTIPPTTDPAVVAVTPTPVAVLPSVRAISTSPGTTVRLLVTALTRGEATLNLPAGTIGTAGPLGTMASWSTTIDLQQTLTLTHADVVVPSTGLIHVSLHVSHPGSPRDLLAPGILIDPPVQVTLHTTEQGVDLIGDFIPGTSYRMSTAATWPDDNTTSGHVLGAYTAESSITVNVPARPPGVWTSDEKIINGQVLVSAHAVDKATVLVQDAEGDETLISNEITWKTTTADHGAPTNISAETLSEALIPGTYRIVIAADTEPPAHWQRRLVVETMSVRPQAVLAALHTLGEAILAGNANADVPVRIVRLAE